MDFEMSFAEQEDVLSIMEEIFTTVFKKHTNWDVTKPPFVRIPYREAMEKYGIDKPDLRNPLIIQDATELFKNTEFNAFKDKTVKIIIVPNGAVQGRKFFDNMNEFDMILPGEKLILEAAEEPELPEEINMELYLKMFMRYLHKNHKRLYLLVESEEEGQEAFRYLQKAYSGIQLVGLAKVSAEGRADDMLVNAINGSEVDCVLSALSVPLQEDFIAKNRNLLDARVWIGVGKKIFSPRKPGFGQGKIAKYLLNHIFRREMEKNKLKMKS